jgi:hypothetical protein
VEDGASIDPAALVQSPCFIGRNVTIAAGATVGRAVWTLLSTTIRPGPALHAWRIEALGLYPARDAVVAAAIAVGFTLLCSARRAVARG